MHLALYTNRFITGLLAAILITAAAPIATSVSAQTQATKGPLLSPSKLSEIRATGSTHFTEAEITAASGLMTGTTVDDEVFRKAARQLGESGAFNDVSYNYTYSSAGTKLTLHVVDADKFVSAHFGDFVWFSDAELLQKVHERIPLFTGMLPTSGSLPDQVSDVLQALLVEDNIPGHVEYLRSNNKDGKLEAFDYTVANIVIQIRHLEFPGAGPGTARNYRLRARNWPAPIIIRRLLHNLVEKKVLPIYHERGVSEGGVRHSSAESCEALLPQMLLTKRAKLPTLM